MYTWQCVHMVTSTKTKLKKFNFLNYHQSVIQCYNAAVEVIVIKQSKKKTKNKKTKHFTSFCEIWHRTTSHTKVKLFAFENLGLVRLRTTFLCSFWDGYSNFANICQNCGFGLYIVRRLSFGALFRKFAVIALEALNTHMELWYYVFK